MASKTDNPTPKGYKKDGTPVNPEGKGGFRDNPENRASGRWKPENSVSYQYNRWNNMDSDLAINYAKVWGIVPKDEADMKDPQFAEFEAKHKAHSLVEERTLRTYIRSMTSLADVREIDSRVEGLPVATVRATIKNDFSDLSVEEQQKLAQALMPVEMRKYGNGDPAQSETPAD